jgi:RimJ/RimL family protein N-acetyltransferase
MIFETARLIARRFGPRDLEAFVAMRNDPRVFRYQSWDGYTEDQGRALLQDLARANPGDPGWFQFALEDRETGQFAGDCGLDVSAKDNRLGEIGYTFRPDFWGRGLCTEAIIGLTRYAFETFGLHRLHASVDPRNIPSCRVLEKAGYTKEAHFRQSLWDKGEWTDDVIYARLRSDI